MINSGSFFNQRRYQNYCNRNKKAGILLNIREFHFSIPSDVLVNDLKLDIACVTTVFVNICEKFSMHAVS